MTGVAGAKPVTVCICCALKPLEVVPRFQVLGKPSLFSPALIGSRSPKFLEYAFICPTNIYFQLRAGYSFRGQGHSDEHMPACLMKLKYSLNSDACSVLPSVRIASVRSELIKHRSILWV